MTTDTSEIIRAVPCRKKTAVPTAGGPVWADPGDWIVTVREGQRVRRTVLTDAEYAAATAPPAPDGDSGDEPATDAGVPDEAMTAQAEALGDESEGDDFEDACDAADPGTGPVADDEPPLVVIDGADVPPGGAAWYGPAAPGDVSDADDIGVGGAPVLDEPVAEELAVVVTPRPTVLDRLRPVAAQVGALLDRMPRRFPPGEEPVPAPKRAPPWHRRRGPAEEPAPVPAAVAVEDEDAPLVAHDPAREHEPELRAVLPLPVAVPGPVEVDVVDADPDPACDDRPVDIATAPPRPDPKPVAEPAGGGPVVVAVPPRERRARRGLRERIAAAVPPIPAVDPAAAGDEDAPLVAARPPARPSAPRASVVDRILGRLLRPPRAAGAGPARPKRRRRPPGVPAPAPEIVAAPRLPATPGHPVVRGAPGRAPPRGPRPVPATATAPAVRPPPGRPRKKGPARARSSKPPKRIIMSGLSPSPESSYGPQIDLAGPAIPGFGPKKPMIGFRAPSHPNNEIQYI